MRQARIEVQQGPGVIESNTAFDPGSFEEGHAAEAGGGERGLRAAEVGVDEDRAAAEPRPVEVTALALEPSLFEVGVGVEFGIGKVGSASEARLVEDRTPGMAAAEIEVDQHGTGQVYLHPSPKGRIGRGALAFAQIMQVLGEDALSGQADLKFLTGNELRIPLVGVGLAIRIRWSERV